MKFDRAANEVRFSHALRAAALLAVGLGALAACGAQSDDGGPAMGERASATAAGGGPNLPDTTPTPPVGPTTTIWPIFAGGPVTAATVGQFATDPVLDFGVVFDGAGNPVHGEMWLAVAKAAKSVRYHLSDAPESGGTSYAGHRVLLKTVSTHTVVNFGAGVNVPLIGDDRDAFVVEHTDLFINSMYVSGGQQCTTPSGQPCKLLRPAGTTDRVSNIPFAASATRKAAIALYAADGTLLETFGRQVSQSGSGSTSCDDFAAAGRKNLEEVGEYPLAFGTAVLRLIAVPQGVIVAGLSSGWSAGSVISGASASVSVTNAVQISALNMVYRTAQPVTNEVLEAAMRMACLAEELGDDLHDTLIEPIDLSGVEDCGGKSVCDTTTATQIGSTATYTGTTVEADGTTIEEWTVSPVIGQECSSSHVEFTCVTG